ncbi:MAG: ATP-grasp domain-containing protein [Chthonomonas sp.]|nr:ATP-grasp domain-containing protein [Chthonomonas sp.]
MQFDLGFLGGGQLARMSIMAAQRMGLSCVSIDPADPSPAGMVAPGAVAKLNDPEALAGMIANCSRVTLENEFIPAGAIAEALQLCHREPEILTPGLETLAIIQDKLKQREALHKAGVPSPHAVAVQLDGTNAISKIGFPMVLKARFGGYDGRGTRMVENAREFADQASEIDDGNWLAEEFVPFKRELAVMVYRSHREFGCFPTVETSQKNFVCDVVFPAETDASEIAKAAVEAIDGYGLFGVEIFETADGKLSVNEIAPRPHNTGHYTLDWGGPSQFEFHVRLSLGLPLPPLDGVPTAMANLLGQLDARDWRSGLQAALEHDPGVAVHWYGKLKSSPGRKMGHINATGPDALARVKSARDAFYAAWCQPEEAARR